ncbi:MAG: metallophosphatase family protein [Rhodocyclaceae bacterium]|nr:metallophosphatase family protein [Rhodocyclaceae bacterium]
MRIALLADIHSNLEALQACLAHARREGVERYVFSATCSATGPIRSPAWTSSPNWPNRAHPSCAATTTPHASAVPCMK